VIDLITQQAQQGDRVAQAKLLRELQDPWYRMSLSLLRDADRARDATQETGLRFLKLLPRFAGNSSLTTWSMGIVINVVREMRRDTVRHESSGDVTTLEMTGNHPSPDQITAGSEQAAMLRATLDSLPDRQREAIVLRFFENLSVEEAAVAMNCATGTVKATVHQALRVLRNKMKQLM
jgi:RNA polymerase sigma-70 factor, ECF subfamily